jgi:hypothetical protein
MPIARREHRERHVPTQGAPAWIGIAVASAISAPALYSASVRRPVTGEPSHEFFAFCVLGVSGAVSRFADVG